MDKTRDNTASPVRITISKFLNRPNIWRIPVYQRHYSWETKKHGPVVLFWESVVEQYFARLNKEQKPDHYLGALLLEHRKEDESGRHEYDVVDGQQRITTIQLALCALIFVAKDNDVEFEVENIFNYISYEDKNRTKPTLHPANFDKKQFEAVFFDTLKTMANLGGDYTKNRESWEKSNVYVTFQFFCEKISKILQENSHPNEEKITALKETLLEDFEVVLIFLKKTDEAQKIFESMNNTAEPLTTFDLIRNDVFYRASKEGADDEELFYSDEWQEFEKPFWVKKSGQRKSSIPHIDDYVARTLIAKKRDLVKFERSELFREYKEFGKQCNSRKEEIKSVSQYIDTYKYLVGEHNNAPGNITCPFFREWNDKAFYSLLFDIFDNDIDPLEKERMMRLLESYAVRRSVYGLTSKGYNKITVEILKKEKKLDYEKLHDFLCAQKVDTTKFPKDEEVKNRIRHVKFFTNSHNIQYYILSEIEKSLRTNQDETIDYDNLTLDHIMPQNGRPEDGWVSDEDQRIVEDHIHTIGNMTLLTGPKIQARVIIHLIK